MKIQDILETFDSDYMKARQDSGIPLFKYIINTFGVTNEQECTELSVLSVKLKELLKLRPDLPVYHEAELLSDIASMLCAFVARLRTMGIGAPLEYIHSFEDPCTLQEAKDALLNVNELSTVEILEVYKEIYHITPILDFVPVTRFEHGDVRSYNAVLGLAMNEVGLREMGLCYTTSLEEVRELAPNLIMAKGMPLPLLVKSGGNNPFAQVADESHEVRAQSVDMYIPLVKV